MQKERLVLVSLATIALAVVFWGGLGSDVQVSSENNPFDSVEGESSPAVISKIQVPVAVHLIIDSNHTFTTRRDGKDFELILENVNRIWGQANIEMQVVEIVPTEITSARGMSMNELANLLQQHPSWRPDIFHLYLAKTINGPNGLAMTDSGMMYVADVTSVNDFRATSHELGHLLGLPHDDFSPNYLMAQGKNGELLLSKEIEKARAIAVNL